MKLCILFLGPLLTLSAFGNVSVYFNQHSEASYTEPHRNITRRGDNLEEVVLKEIRSAKKSIYLAVQELRLPQIAAALIQKKMEGLDVRVILEHDYNFNVLAQRETSPEGEYEASKPSSLQAFVDLNRDGKISKDELETRDAIYMLQNSKIPIMDDTFDSSMGSGLMHHKFVIIDGKTTIVSTANFTMSCIHGDILTSSTRGNANSMIVVQSPNFAKTFNEEFFQMWGNGKRGNFGHYKTYRRPVTTSVKGSKITIQFSPTSRRYQWEETVNGLIAEHLKKATKSVKAALFVFSDQKISNALQLRHEAGAEVGVIIEPKFAFRDYSELLDLMGIEMLNRKCQYEVENSPWKRPAKEVGMAYLPDGDFLHHKFAVIDNKTVIVGSQNWSDSANLINDETLIVIQDAVVADKFSKEYARIKKSAFLGVPTWVKQNIKRQEAACADLGRY